ncbi:MAG: alpha/beta hydrolase [Rhodobacteraceae bacterium]|nr:alpha/beta hydrolase [Paracoccaceae bacterium]
MRDLPPHRIYGSGPRPVLALHCSLAHGGEWAGLVGHLPGVRLMAPDLPGHGRQPIWDGQSDTHAEATRQAADCAAALGAPIDLIGHSFGATVALRLALERPELVRSLVLIEPVLFAAAKAAEDPRFAAFASREGRFRDLLAEGQAEAATEAFLAVWGSDRPFPDLPPEARAYMVARIGLVAALDPVLMGDAAGLLRYLGLESLGVPVLLVQGDQSPPIIDAIQTELARRLPMVSRAVVPGAGHMLPVTHAAALAPLIAAHLGL